MPEQHFLTINMQNVANTLQYDMKLLGFAQCDLGVTLVGRTAAVLNVSHLVAQ